MKSKFMFIAVFALGAVCFTVNQSEASTSKQIPNQISRSVKCSLVPEYGTEPYKEVIILDYKLGFGIAPEILMYISGNIGAGPLPGGHWMEVGPVSFNGQASCEDRTQYCNTGYEEAIADSENMILKAPSIFVTFVDGKMWNLSVPTDRIASQIKGHIEIQDDEFPSVPLICSVSMKK